MKNAERYAMNPKILKAIELAFVKHDGQYRKGTKTPYITHPMAVMNLILMEQADDNSIGDDVVIAGILHDVFEDTDATLNEIEKDFGAEVKRLVENSSEPEELKKQEDKRGTWKERKLHTIQHLSLLDKYSKIISCCDKLHNAQSMNNDYMFVGDELWGRINYSMLINRENILMRKKTYSYLTLKTSLLALASLLFVCQLDGWTEDFFPLTKGSYWIYKGPTKWIGLNSGEIIKKTLTWKMEVVDAFTYNSADVAVIKGHPSDLAWYDEGKSRGNYLIIRFPAEMTHKSDKFVLLRDQQADEALKKMLNKEYHFSNFSEYSDYDLFLDFPLIPGEKMEQSEQTSRPDNFYCWFVESKDQIQLSKVKGISPSRKMTHYRLVYRSMPDDTTIEYAQGIGIIRYAYNHHGTISQTDLRLIEYKKGKVPAPAKVKKKSKQKPSME